MSQNPKSSEERRIQPEQRTRYEAPRILSKRRVERTTLVTGDGGPNGGVGGE